MVFCSYCGTKNEDAAKFCIKCGSTLQVSMEKSLEKRIEEGAEEFGKRAEVWGKDFGKRSDQSPCRTGGSGLSHRRTLPE